MSYPAFSKSGMTTFTFSRGPEYPDAAQPNPRQTVTYSEAGQARIVTYPGEEELFPLTFERLPGADDTALLAWWRHASIAWSAYKFTYTDVLAVAHTVRLVEGTYTRARVPGGFNISFTLRRENF